MLVTRRRPSESILIGGDVEVKVLEIGPSWVKLGIVAPQQVTVLRKEVQVISEENRTAADTLARGGLDHLVRRLGKNPAELKVHDPRPI